VPCYFETKENTELVQWEPISLKEVTAYPLRKRKSKVHLGDFSKPWTQGETFQHWLDNLPEILAAKDFRQITHAMAQAIEKGKLIILAMGAHPMKVGLNPIIIDLMERGLISAIALNGAGIVHDSELAMIGKTSEDVPEQLGEGKFGMSEETGRFVNRAIRDGVKGDCGLGQAVGAMLVKENFPYNKQSLLARAYELDMPVTVHVAIGTDVIHCHPDVDGAALGRTSHLDFRIFAGLVSRLDEGVFINLGSAVILPEVFLKALSLVRNLGYPVKNLTTVNMDFIHHYRPMTNVVNRPTQEGGQGYALLGHHEIMFPLLAAALIEEVERKL
jgi:hypothetical protein